MQNVVSGEVYEIINVLQTCYDNIYYAYYIYQSFNDRGKLIKNMIISLILPCVIGKH